MALVMNMVQASITPDLIQSAGRTIGEDSSAVQRTLSLAVPTILAGALVQGRTQAGAERLRSMITDSQFAGNGPGHFSHMLERTETIDSPLRAGERVFSDLFVGRADDVTDAVANAGGVQRSSAATLLSMAAPLVVSVVARQVTSRNLDAGGLMNLLESERDSVRHALPPGLASELGLGESQPAAARSHTEPGESVPVHQAQPKREQRVHVTEQRRRSLKPLLIGGLAGLALLFFLARNREEPVEVQAPPAAELPATPPVMPAPAPPVTTPEAPSAAQPAAPISELSTFLTSATAGSTPRSFLLEGVQFQNGSSKLSADARSSIKSVADVLVAHPGTQVRIESITGSNGGAAANRKLSDARADEVKKALVSAGVPADRISTGSVAADPVAGTQAGQTVLVVHRF